MIETILCSLFNGLVIGALAWCAFGSLFAGVIGFVLAGGATTAAMMFFQGASRWKNQ